MAAIISVPAGRSLRRSPETKWVDPQPDKGLLEMKMEDGLMHLWWKSRDTGTMEDELIIFPGEASFENVQQDTSGRTHILKFSSSDQKYFFWFQRASKEGDVRAEVDIHSLLQDPYYQPGTASLPDQPVAPAQTTTGAQEERSWPPTPGAPRLSHPEPAPPANAGSTTAAAAGAAGSAGPSASNEQQTQDMARMLAEWAQSGGLSIQEDAQLTDVLSSSNVSSLLHSHPELVSTLIPLLPTTLSLPSNPTPDDLVPILTAPQFTDAIASLDNALRSGGLPGGMMRELGLPKSAGSGVKEFLEALQALGNHGQEDDRMEED